MKDQALRLALEALECALSDDKPYIDKCNRAITTIKQALAEQPAQQEPKIDIYRSFEQWKSGNVLEHGVPRTEHYSEAQLDLVEMGWNYGYDAGRAVEQALDKKADNARELGLDYEPEPVAWMHKHIDDTVIAHRPADLDRHPERWMALYAEPKPCQTCEALARTVMLDQTSHDTPPKREWQGLTSVDWNDFNAVKGHDPQYVAQWAESKLKEKNHDQ